MASDNQKMIMVAIIGLLGGFIIFSALSNRSSNLEVWKYADWRGKERTIEVHRQVE